MAATKHSPFRWTCASRVHNPNDTHRAQRIILATCKFSIIIHYQSYAERMVEMHETIPLDPNAAAASRTYFHSRMHDNQGALFEIPHVISHDAVNSRTSAATQCRRSFQSLQPHLSAFTCRTVARARAFQHRSCEREREPCAVRVSVRWDTSSLIDSFKCFASCE